MHDVLGDVVFFGYICGVRDYYDTLGVPPSATRLEIQQAFQRLALKFHPERNAHDPFFTLHYNRVKEAYEVLSDEHKRFRYDKALQEKNGVLDASLMEVPPPVIASFFASKKASQRGDALTISWEVLNADEVRINLIGEVASNGTQTIRLTEVMPYQPYINIDLEAINDSHPIPVKQRWQLKNLAYDGTPVPEVKETEVMPAYNRFEEGDVLETEEPDIELPIQTRTKQPLAKAPRTLRLQEPNPNSRLMAYGIIVVLFFMIVLMLYILFSINPIF